MERKPRGYVSCDYELCIKDKRAHTESELVVTQGWVERNETVNGDEEEGNGRLTVGDLYDLQRKQSIVLELDRSDSCTTLFITQLIIHLTTGN